MIDLRRRFFLFGASVALVVPPVRSIFVMPPVGHQPYFAKFKGQILKHAVPLEVLESRVSLTNELIAYGHFRREGEWLRFGNIMGYCPPRVEDV